MKKDNIKCYLLGHKVDDNYNDSGYWICKRCQEHEFYDYIANNDVKMSESIWHKGGLLFRPYYFVKGIFFRIKYFIQHFRLKYIDKSDLPF